MAKNNKPLENDSTIHIRLPKDLRDKAQTKADANAQNLSELVRRFLQAYVEEK